MTKSKFLFLILILFSFDNKGFSQSLTIQETINYLNKIFMQTSEHVTIRPLRYRVTPIDADYNSIKDWGDKSEYWRLSNDSQMHVYAGCKVETFFTVSIDKEGFLKFQRTVTMTNCNDKKNNVENDLRESDKINIDDIDLERITSYLPSTDESNDNDSKDCEAVVIPCIDNDVKCIYCESKYGRMINNELKFNFKKAAYTLYIYSNDIKYDTKRFYNALMYVIYSAKEQGYHRQRNDEHDPFVSPSTDDNRTLNKSTNSKAEYRIPLKKENGVLTLIVNLGGRTNAKFILDSGAGESNISSDLEKRLLANGVIKEKDYLTNGLYKLADGSIQECKRVRISKIVVGDKTFY
ncbi:MAG TPA: hypothetical protein VFI29_11185, partial [Hanamia sp.]|nr:hypothetical protein [Hanamia sp.]